MATGQRCKVIHTLGQNHCRTRKSERYMLAIPSNEAAVLVHGGPINDPQKLLHSSPLGEELLRLHILHGNKL